jgi:uncharacterized protein DUF6626
MTTLQTIDMPLHEEIYEFLRLNRMVNNRADYCREYLGKSRTYMNTLRYSNHTPSREAYEHLVQKLDGSDCHVIEEYRQKVRAEISM